MGFCGAQLSYEIHCFCARVDMFSKKNTLFCSKPLTKRMGFCTDKKLFGNPTTRALNHGVMLTYLGFALTMESSRVCSAITQKYFKWVPRTSQGRLIWWKNFKHRFSSRFSTRSATKMRLECCGSQAETNQCRKLILAYVVWGRLRGQLFAKKIGFDILVRDFFIGARTFLLYRKHHPTT